MPKPRRIVRTTEEISDDEPRVRAPEIDPELEADAESLHSVLEQFGEGDVSIKVSKETPRGLQYCYKSTGEIDEDFIQSSFGGGRYACRIFVNGVYRLTKQLNIAERIANPVGAGGGGDLQLRLLEQQVNFLRDIVLKGGAGSQQTPVGELADAVSKVYALGQGGPGNQSFEMFIKAFELARSVMNESSGNPSRSDWKDTLLSVAREALPMLGGAMAQRPGGPMPGEQQPQVSNEDQIIRQGLAYLKRKALTMPCELALAWVVSNADEEPFRQVLQLVVNREFAAFTAIDPEIGNEPYYSWFRTFYDGLRSEYPQSNSVAPDPVRSDGDAGDATNDAPPSSRGRANGSGKTTRH